MVYQMRKCPTVWFTPLPEYNVSKFNKKKQQSCGNLKSFLILHVQFSM